MVRRSQNGAEEQGIIKVSSNSRTPLLLTRSRLPKTKRQSKAMKIHVLFFLLLLACMYPSLAQGTYENCCLKHANEVKENVKKRVVSYRVQQTDGGCNIHAVVFTLKKGRTFCGDPRKLWVQALMKRADTRN